MEQVNELQSEVRQLKLGRESTQACRQMFKLSLYVRVSGDVVGKSKLESLLGCEVLQYVRLISNSTPSYKVKIKEGDLDSALAKGRREGSKVLVLSKHWLWPYDLHMLNDINQDCDAIGKADSRLTAERDGGRGCGGIGLL